MSFSTIQVSKKTHERLKELKGDMSFDTLIWKLLEGESVRNISELEKVNRSKIAFKLEFYEYDVDESTFFDVSFYDLQNTVVGGEFKVPHTSNSRFFLEQSARIVYRDDDCVLVKIKTVNKTEEGTFVDIEMVNVEFL